MTGQLIKKKRQEEGRQQLKGREREKGTNISSPTTGRVRTSFTTTRPRNGTPANTVSFLSISPHRSRRGVTYQVFGTLYTIPLFSSPSSKSSIDAEETAVPRAPLRMTAMMSSAR